MLLRSMEEAREARASVIQQGGISEVMSNDDLPNVHAKDPEKKPKDAEVTHENAQVALVKIIDALRPLSREARIRVLKTASTFFGDPPNGSSGIR